MAYRAGHGHEALRRGRWSAPRAEYFLTICTHDRRRGLSDEPLLSRILEEAHRRETESDWSVRTLVVMPDHLHLLVVLGESMELAESLRLFKGRMAPQLRKHDLRWERGYFDHRVRVDEDRWPLFGYVFLNPYRAGLVSAEEKWPGYYCAPTDWAWFGPMTDEACPYLEWLA